MFTSKFYFICLLVNHKINNFTSKQKSIFSIVFKIFVTSIANMTHFTNLLQLFPLFCWNTIDIKIFWVFRQKKKKNKTKRKKSTSKLSLFSWPEKKKTKQNNNNKRNHQLKQIFQCLFLFSFIHLSFSKLAFFCRDVISWINKTHIPHMKSIFLIYLILCMLVLE